MALVEAVAGELGHQVEDAAGLLGRHAPLQRPGDEPRPLQVHLLLLFLAHRPAQQVRLAQAEARQDLGDLHHLFLVDDDPVGLLQHGFERGVQDVDLGPAELAVDVGVDVLHRPRPVERDQGGDLLDRRAAELAQGVAHPLAFQLEHPDGLARGQQLVGRGVVERQGVEVRRRPPLPEVAHRPVQHRERLQTQEVELHQARALDPLHVELGGGQRRARVLVEGGELGQGPVADDDAGRVGRGVAEQPLQPQRHLEQAGDRGVLLLGLLQPGLQLDRLGQGHRIGRVVRHHLGQPVDQPQRQLHHPADVAQHGAGLQGAEGDDLGHPVAAVLLLDVGDRLLAPLLAEVDVEVGHRHPLRVQEPLEQQAEAQGVEVGDGQGPGHHRAGARAAARADRDRLGLGPLDEVRDDQEVAGEAHGGDHPDLPLQPVPVVLLRKGVGSGGEPRLEPLAGLVGQLLRLRAARGRGEAGQDRVALLDHEGAAPGDVEGGVAGLRQVGESPAHGLGRLEPMLGGDPAAVVLGQEGAVGDAHQGVVRRVHAGFGEIDVVGGDQGHVVVVGPAD